MANEQNLKPFKKNDPRINRKGQPRVLPELKEILSMVLAEEKDGITALEEILKALKNKAIKGDVRAIQEVLDRHYGKVKQDIGLSGVLNLPITGVKIVKD